MKTPFAAAVLAACLATGIVAAQTQAPTPPPGAAAMDAIRQAAATDKRGLVERNMQLTAQEASKFWPIYDAYQKDLERVVKRQNRAVLDYVNAEASMTDANAKRIVNEILAADADEQKAQERVVKKLMAALPARKAVRYMQIENKLRTFYRNDLAERIPLVR